MKAYRLKVGFGRGQLNRHTILNLGQCDKSEIVEKMTNHPKTNALSFVK